jgi:hypothetical protein
MFSKNPRTTIFILTLFLAISTIAFAAECTLDPEIGQDKPNKVTIKPQGAIITGKGETAVKVDYEHGQYDNNGKKVRVGKGTVDLTKAKIAPKSWEASAFTTTNNSTYWIDAYLTWADAAGQTKKNNAVSKEINP